MALSEDQPAGLIPASGKVGLKQREDLMRAEQSPYDAGVGPSGAVVDKPEALRKLPVRPAPAMLIGISYHCREPAQPALARRLRFQHAKFIDDDRTGETPLPRCGGFEPFGNTVRVGRGNDGLIQSREGLGFLRFQQLLAKPLNAGIAVTKGVRQPADTAQRLLR